MSEVRDDEQREDREDAGALVDGNENARLTEAHDIGAAGAGELSQGPRVLIDTPTAGIEPEIVDHGHRCEIERTVAVAERDVNAVVAEADDVDAADAADVRKEARMAVDPPAARVETEVAEHRDRR